MIIDLTRLKNGIDEYIEINKVIKFDSNYSKNTELIDLKDTVLKGTIYKNSVDHIIIDFELEGCMILPCSITLKPVDYKFNCVINGDIEEIYEEIDKNDKKSENSIDILPIIWENILMEIPMRVVSEEAKDIKLSGDGWKLVTEEETNKPLSGLADLLDDREVK